jgi:hypothetical protein
MERIRLEVKLESLTGVYDNAEWQIKLLFRQLTTEQQTWLPEWLKVARQVACELLAAQQIVDYRKGLSEHDWNEAVARERRHLVESKAQPTAQELEALL